MAENDSNMVLATFDDFMKIDIRCGTIIEAAPFPEARKPAIKLVIDFGAEIGTRKSSAQITELYSPETLVGRKVMALVNFPPRQIGPFMSEVLTLGVANERGEVVLVTPDSDAPDGSRMHCPVSRARPVSDRQLYRDPKPAKRRVTKRKFAAMPENDVTGNRQSKARSAGLSVARSFQTDKGADGVGTSFRRDSGAIVVKMDRHLVIAKTG